MVPDTEPMTVAVTGSVSESEGSGSRDDTSVFDPELDPEGTAGGGKTVTVPGGGNVLPSVPPPPITVTVPGEEDVVVDKDPAGDPDSRLALVTAAPDDGEGTGGKTVTVPGGEAVGGRTVTVLGTDGSSALPLV